MLLQRSLSYHDFKAAAPPFSHIAMLHKLFRKTPRAMTGTKRPRGASASPSADRAASLLHAPSALMQLSYEEARIVVSYMKPHRIAEGTTFIKEGDTANTDFMVLVLEGEVTVESIVVSRTEPITAAVLGPGSLIGEMGLLDGEPRSASCTATRQVNCAMLTRTALNKLLDDDPRTAAKLMMAISLRIAERMRESAEKLKMYAQLTQAMQHEIHRLGPG